MVLPANRTKLFVTFFIEYDDWNSVLCSVSAIITRLKLNIEISIPFCLQYSFDKYILREDFGPCSLLLEVS